MATSKSTNNKKKKTKLTYDLLERLVILDDDDDSIELKVVTKGVSRLGGDDHDRTRIELGENVVFVASFELHITEDVYDLWENDLYLDKRDVGAILAIDKDGNVISPRGYEFDRDEIARWIGEHYEFIFRLTGLERAPFRPYRPQPVDAELYGTVYPWLQELNVISVVGDVIDIEFDARPRKRKPYVRDTELSTDTRVGFDEAELRLAISVAGNRDALEKLRCREYWIDLRSDTDPDLKLKIKVEKITVRETDRKRLLTEAPAIAEAE